MTKKVKLTEKQINKAINEISYGTVDDARQKDYNLFNRIIGGYEEFHEALDELRNKFDSFESDLYRNGDYNPYSPMFNNPHHNKIAAALNEIGNYVTNIETISDDLNKLLSRKENQIGNFEDATNEYEDTHGDDDVSWDEFRNGEIHNI